MWYENCKQRLNNCYDKTSYEQGFRSILNNCKKSNSRQLICQNLSLHKFKINELIIVENSKAGFFGSQTEVFLNNQLFETYDYNPFNNKILRNFNKLTNQKKLSISKLEHLEDIDCNRAKKELRLKENCYIASFFSKNSQENEYYFKLDSIYFYGD